MSPLAWKVLFVAENITLAQVTRLVKLASSLRSEIEIHFACSHFDPLIFHSYNFHTWKITTIRKQDVMDKLRKGEAIYSISLLQTYVSEEMEIMKKIKPHVVVGDFRLSLSISTALLGIPFINLINAYWSPYAIRSVFPMPDHPIVKLLGEKVASAFFPLVKPWYFKHFASPVNTLRKKYGLKEIGDLLDVLTYGDYVIYPDIPEIVSLAHLPTNHFFIGHVGWSPQGLEEKETQGDKPYIYVTLGSSGNIDNTDILIHTLSKLPYRVYLSTAGRKVSIHPSSPVIVKDFLPGKEMAGKALLVISNGGSSTGYQALAEGTPVLGIPTNMDQYLASEAIHRTKAGSYVRSDTLSASRFLCILEEMMGNKSYKENALKVKESFTQYNSTQLFEKVLDKALMN